MKKRFNVIFAIGVVCVICILLSLSIAPSQERFFSTSDENVGIAKAVEGIVKKFNVTSICDIACGDCGWVPVFLGMMPNLKYIGYEKDVALVNKGKDNLSNYSNASIQMADPLSVTPPQSDLVLCRNLMSTLSYEGIKQAVMKLSQYDCKFFALGSFAHNSSDNRNLQNAGTFLINLEKHPFNMSPADTADEKANNRLLFVYTIDQMKGYINANAFWTTTDFD